MQTINPNAHFRIYMRTTFSSQCLCNSYHLQDFVFNWSTHITFIDWSIFNLLLGSWLGGGAQKRPHKLEWSTQKRRRYFVCKKKRGSLCWKTSTRWENPQWVPFKQIEGKERNKTEIAREIHCSLKPKAASTWER